MLSFTVRQPGDEQGRAAVDAALALIAGESLDTVSGVTLGEDELSLMIPYEPVDAEKRRGIYFLTPILPDCGYTVRLFMRHI